MAHFELGIGNPKLLEYHQTYLTPRKIDWPYYNGSEYISHPWSTAKGEGPHLGMERFDELSMANLSINDLKSLRLLEIKFNYEKERGKISKAPVYNVKKLEVCRGVWCKDFKPDALSPKLYAAYKWLMLNPVYAKYFKLWEDAVSKGEKFISTSKLLLQFHGIEVAAFPWLYIREEYSDTYNNLKGQVCPADHIDNLLALRTPENSIESDWALKGKLYSIKKSFLRKVMSYCRSYEQERDLYFLIHDICLARSIVSSLSQAEKLGITADIVTDSMVHSASYWLHQQEYTVDMCRIMKKRMVTGWGILSFMK